jgi:glycosyltransferase involved in cell wall biosynthesis
VSPEIAVVIPSRRGPRLAFALEALAAQTLEPAQFEVVVVRDPASEIRESPVLPRLPVRFLSAPEPCGPTVKRNLGWRATRAPLVAFTDDDCRPAREWLERLLAAGADEEEFLQGRTEPDPDEAHLLHGLARSQRIEGPSGWFQACNLAFPRTMLERLDGFDEDFYFGSEDTDLGLRGLEAGYRRRYVDDAVVRHAVIPRTLPRAIAEAGRWPSQPLVLRRHPQLRGVIYRRFFYRRSHAMLLLAAAGASVARRHPMLAVVASAPYVEMYVGGRPLTPRRLARQLAGLPSRALVDAVEVAATARSAWRHRVPVL